MVNLNIRLFLISMFFLSELRKFETSFEDLRTTMTYEALPSSCPGTMFVTRNHQMVMDVVLTECKYKYYLMMVCLVVSTPFFFVKRLSP